MMRKEAKPIDVSNLPELLRIAEEVQKTGEPCVLRRGGEDVALITPVIQRPRRRLKGRPTGKDDPLWNIIGIATGSDDGPTDVSANKHKYLADAYEAKAHRSKEP